MFMLVYRQNITDQLTTADIRRVNGTSVSYTHLDVYKRQVVESAPGSPRERPLPCAKNNANAKECYMDAEKMAHGLW